MARKRWKKPAIVAGLLVGAVALLAVPLLMPPDVDQLLASADLASLPPQAEVLSVQGDSSIFSRDYTVRFRAMENEIALWLLDCPGLMQREPIRTDDETFYSLITQDGGTIAEIAVYHPESTVRVRIRDVPRETLIRADTFNGTPRPDGFTFDE